jgi:hypothetical protein
MLKQYTMHSLIPMPSSGVTPKSRSMAASVSAGSGSPALTACRQVEKSKCFAPSAAAISMRYVVGGAVKLVMRYF